jgi:UDP-N-acetyl-2-amino-2-deoxyglucuronate dehydrogenase
MTQKMYGIGIVGCGTISGTHAEAINGSKQGRLVAAYSRTPENVEAFCSEYDAEGFSDYQAFLDYEELDAVAICTPSGTHLDYGRHAAEAGKHVIVEKPIEVSVKRGLELIDSCRTNDVGLAVIYQNRFLDEAIRMQEAVQNGQVGQPVLVDAAVKWFRDQEYYDSGGWRGSLDLDGGGAAINQAIHTVDLLLWICGEVESVQAYKGTLTHSGIEGEDNVVASLRFKNGALGVFTASTSVVPPQNRKIEIHGTDGTALLDGNRFQIITADDSADTSRGGDAVGASSPMAGMTGNLHQKQYDNILAAFTNRSVPVVSGEESLKSLAFVQALYESSRRQEAVAIDQLFSV